MADKLDPSFAGQINKDGKLVRGGKPVLSPRGNPIVFGENIELWAKLLNDREGANYIVGVLRDLHRQLDELQRITPKLKQYAREAGDAEAIEILRKVQDCRLDRDEKSMEYLAKWVTDGGAASDGRRSSRPKGVETNKAKGKKTEEIVMAEARKLIDAGFDPGANLRNLPSKIEALIRKPKKDAIRNHIQKPENKTELEARWQMKMK